MVAVVVTPEILQLVSNTKGESKVNKTSTVSTISHTQLLTALHTKNVKNCSKAGKTTLQRLLSNTEIYTTHENAVEKLIPKQRDPKLERRMCELRKRLENKQYANMVKDVSRVNASDNLQIEQLRMSKLAPQMSLGFNVIVTMATCFVAAYYVFKNSTGNVTVGLIAGVIAVIIAMIVEIILLMTKLYSIDNAVRKQKELQHRKDSPIIRQ